MSHQREQSTGVVEAGSTVERFRRLIGVKLWLRYRYQKEGDELVLAGCCGTSFVREILNWYQVILWCRFYKAMVRARIIMEPRWVSFNYYGQT